MDEQHDETPVNGSSDPGNISDMGNFVPPIKPKHVLKGFLKFGLILVVVAGLAGGAFWFGSSYKPSKPAPKVTRPATSSSSTSATKVASATKLYNSPNYNLGFNYPADWVVSDNAGSNLTVTSPMLQLKDAAGQTQSGKVLFTIQNKQTTIPLLAPGNAVAALESEKIAYKTPTPNQRAQTYVTFVNYKGLTSSIDTLYITGDNGYKSGQSVPQADVVQDDPLITITFLKCADAKCAAAQTTMGIGVSSWKDANLSTPLLDLLKSLTIS